MAVPQLTLRALLTYSNGYWTGRWSRYLLFNYHTGEEQNICLGEETWHSVETRGIKNPAIKLYPLSFIIRGTTSQNLYRPARYLHLSGKTLLWFTCNLKNKIKLDFYLTNWVQDAPNCGGMDRVKSRIIEGLFNMCIILFPLRRHAWNCILSTSALVKQNNKGSDTEVLHIIHDLEVINVTLSHYCHKMPSE